MSVTEMGPYAAAVAAAALAWGVAARVTPLAARPEFRRSARHATFAAAACLAVAIAGLARAAFAPDVRYGFVVPYAAEEDRIAAGLAALLSPGPRLFVLLAWFAVLGAVALRRAGSSELACRRGALHAALLLVGLVAVLAAANPWVSESLAWAPAPPETLEPAAVLAGHLRVVAVAGFAVVFVLLWPAVRQSFAWGGWLAGPYAWGAVAWLVLTLAALAEYASLEGRGPTGVVLRWVAQGTAVPWFLGLAFLHAAGLGRRRPSPGLLPVGLGAALFPLALPLAADAWSPLPWAAGGVAALLLAFAAVARAGGVASPRSAFAAWSRDAWVRAAALALAGVAALSLGAVLVQGALPEALWTALGAVGAGTAALALVFPAGRGRPARLAVRLAPSVLLGFVVAAAASFLAGDLRVGVGGALAAAMLAIGARECLAARPRRPPAWICGAALAHLGLALAFTGAAASRLGAESVAAVRPGGLVVAEPGLGGAVRVRYLGLSLYRAPQADVHAASLEVEGTGLRTRLARAEQWWSPLSGTALRVPLTIRAPLRAVDVDLAEILSAPQEHVRLLVRVRPLAGLLWAGGALFAIGAALGLASAGGARTPRVAGAPTGAAERSPEAPTPPQAAAPPELTEGRDGVHDPVLQPRPPGQDAP